MFTRGHLAIQNKSRYHSESSRNHFDESTGRKNKKSLSKTKSNRMFDFYSSQTNHNSVSSTIRKYYHISKNSQRVNSTQSFVPPTLSKMSTPQKSINNRKQRIKTNAEDQENGNKLSIKMKVQYSAMRKYIETFKKNRIAKDQTTKCLNQKSRQNLIEKLKQMKEKSVERNSPSKQTNEIFHEKSQISQFQATPTKIKYEPQITEEKKRISLATQTQETQPIKKPIKAQKIYQQSMVEKPKDIQTKVQEKIVEKKIPQLVITTIETQDISQQKKIQKPSSNQNFWNVAQFQDSTMVKLPQQKPQETPKEKKIKIVKQINQKQYSDELQSISFGKPIVQEKVQFHQSKFQSQSGCSENKSQCIDEIREYLYLVDTIGDYPTQARLFYEKAFLQKTKTNFKQNCYVLFQQFYYLRKNLTQILREKKRNFFHLNKRDLKRNAKEVDEIVKELDEENEKCKLMMKKLYNFGRDGLPEKQRVFSIDHHINHYPKCIKKIANEFKENCQEYKHAIKSGKDEKKWLERICYTMEIYFLLKELNGEKVKEFDELEEIKNLQNHYQKWKHLIV